MLTLEGRRKDLMTQIMQAQDLDAKDQLMDALKKYLTCLKILSEQLILECHLPEFVSNEKNKQWIELSTLCVDRLKIIFERLQQQKITFIPQSLARVTLDPLQKAMQTNKQIVKSHINMTSKFPQPTNKHATINKNLSLQRRLAENIHVAKKHQIMLEKRRREKEEEIERQTDVTLSRHMLNEPDDMIKKKIYLEVIHFDKHNAFLRDVRSQSRESWRNNCFLKKLINTVFNTPEHPLCKYIKGEQFRMSFEIQTLSQQLNNIRKSKMNEDEVNEMVMGNSCVISHDVGGFKGGEGHYEGDVEDGESEGDGKGRIDKGFNLGDNGIIHRHENNEVRKYNYNDDDDNYKSLEKINVTKGISSLIHEIKRSFKRCCQTFVLSYDFTGVLSNNKNNNNNNINNNNNNNVNKEIIKEDVLGGGMEEGVVEGLMDGLYYRSLWEALRELFKKLNYDSWREVKNVMERFKDEIDLSSFAIKENLQLMMKSEPRKTKEKKFEEIKEESEGNKNESKQIVEGNFSFMRLKEKDERDGWKEKDERDGWKGDDVVCEDGWKGDDVACEDGWKGDDVACEDGWKGDDAACEDGREKPRQEYCPYSSTIKILKSASDAEPVKSKLQLYSCGIQEVCREVQLFYDQLHLPPPPIGADELLPIITYTLVRTRDPMIYLDCCILMELMDDKESIGEEGYCITTLITSFEHWALSSLLTQSN